MNSADAGVGKFGETIMILKWTELYKVVMQQHIDDYIGQLESLVSSIFTTQNSSDSDDDEEEEQPECYSEKMICFPMNEEYPDNLQPNRYYINGNWSIFVSSNRNKARCTISDEAKKIYRQLHEAVRKQLVVEQRTKKHILYVKVKKISYQSPDNYFISLESGYYAVDGSSTRLIPPILQAQSVLKAGVSYVRKLRKLYPDPKDKNHLIDKSDWVIRNDENKEGDMSEYDLLFTCEWCEAKQQERTSMLYVIPKVFHHIEYELCASCTEIMEHVIDEYNNTIN